MRHRAPTIAVLAFALAACGGVREQIRVGSLPGAKAFDARELIDVLPPDRIPAIVHPTYQSSAKAAEWLTPSEPVVALAVGPEARAYPLAILVWHEIVDDVIGGVPVAVTYAPLANAAVVFDRRVAGRLESFAVSGKLYRSDLVMFDRRTTSLWTQLDGRAVAGPARGSTLQQVPAQIVALETFRKAFPNGAVLARPAASGRGYGFNPYAGYDSRSKPFGGFIALTPDERRRPMTRVVGVGGGADAHAYPYEALRSSPVTAGRLSGRDIVVLWEPGARSALDTVRIAAGKDVGQTGVFYPVVKGRRLDLTTAADGFSDRQTGSTWSVLGVATAGPLKGQRLEPIAHVDTFWFAWSAFFPGTSS